MKSVREVSPILLIARWRNLVTRLDASLITINNAAIATFQLPHLTAVSRCDRTNLVGAAQATAASYLHLKHCDAGSV